MQSKSYLGGGLLGADTHTSSNMSPIEWLVEVKPSIWGCLESPTAEMTSILPTLESQECLVTPPVLAPPAASDPSPTMLVSALIPL